MTRQVARIAVEHMTEQELLKTLVTRLSAVAGYWDAGELRYGRQALLSARQIAAELRMRGTQLELFGALAAGPYASRTTHCPACGERIDAILARDVRQ